MLFAFRSEWEEFWRTATSAPNLYIGNEYELRTPSYDPYVYKNPFDPLGQAHKTSVVDPFAFYTTKSPLVDEFQKNWYQAAFKSKFPDKVDAFAKKEAKSSLEEFNNLFYGRTTQQQNNDLYSYTRNDQLGK